MATDNSTEGVPDAFKLGKVLAAQEKETRDKGVEILTTWLRTKKNATELDYMKVWRALFYCLWMSDKPIIQHELARMLSALIHVPPTPEASLLFIQAFLKTIIREWAGIDKFRLDKYLWLLRFFVSDYMRFLKEHDYDDDLFDAMNLILLETALNPETALTYHGLMDHLIDVFLMELSKHLGDEWWLAEEDILLSFFFPWLQLLASCDNPSVVHHLVDEIWENVVAAYVRVRAEESRATGETLKKAQKSKNQFLSLMQTFDEAIFELAKSPDTLERNRKALYNLHSTFQLNMVEKSSASKKRERTPSSHDESIVNNSIKKSKQHEVDSDSSTDGKSQTQKSSSSDRSPKSQKSSASSSSQPSKQSRDSLVSNGKDSSKGSKNKQPAPLSDSISSSSDEEIHGEFSSDGGMIDDGADGSSGSEDMDDFGEMDEDALMAAINGDGSDDDDAGAFGEVSSSDSEEEEVLKNKKFVKMIKTPPKGEKKPTSTSSSPASTKSTGPSPKKVSWSEQSAQILKKKHPRQMSSPPPKSILKPTPPGPISRSIHDATEINSVSKFASPYNHAPQQRVLTKPVVRITNAQRKQLIKQTMKQAMMR